VPSKRLEHSYEDGSGSKTEGEVGAGTQEGKMAGSEHTAVKSPPVGYHISRLMPVDCSTPAITRHDLPRPTKSKARVVSWATKLAAEHRRISQPVPKKKPPPRLASWPKLANEAQPRTTNLRAEIAQRDAHRQKRAGFGRLSCRIWPFCRRESGVGARLRPAFLDSPATARGARAIQTLRGLPLLAPRAKNCAHSHKMVWFF
jgi:hypothetical protein